eukprot:GFKZ01010140.1.p1 GENE.GFKZ01010140.1~~GFKZ01010140.1.p1  ORF type:complete len:334 (-),score=43.07 GFKZ01010140.1:774-1775(-)
MHDCFNQPTLALEIPQSSPDPEPDMSAFLPTPPPTSFSFQSWRSHFAARKRQPVVATIRPVVVAESRPRPGVDFHGIPNPPPGSRLMLSDLRERLIRQEETIIFALIERAQFKQNLRIYTRGAFNLPQDTSCDGTFSQYLLFELEKVYANVRRYTSPDEHPFAPQSVLPAPILTRLEYPPTLAENTINVNAEIESDYRKNIIPAICEPDDDQNYGSSATCDVACLQALSKRIHYGMFIAEAKCQENELKYKQLAANLDRDGIWSELSNLEVEKSLLKRVENKAKSYGSDVTVNGVRNVYKVQPQKIAELYRDFIIPLTKEVEVEYILQRYGYA